MSDRAESVTLIDMEKPGKSGVMALLLVSTLLCVTFVFSSCASSEKRERERSVKLLHRLILQNLHVRRPGGPGADPRATPGGVDFYSAPRPGANYDCQKLAEIYQALPIAKLKDCIAELQKTGAVFQYRVRKLPVPVLELEEPEVAPVCVRETLATIPVPREIFFQSAEEERLECYGSRLAIESDEVPGFGVKWPLSKARVRVSFPLQPFPDQLTNENVATLLGTWSLAPFFNEAGEIAAKIVPEKICKQCLGPANWLDPEGGPVPHWPE